MTFSSLQLAQLTGGSLTLRQLQWWDEKDVISPKHVGHRREYDGVQALSVLILWKLRSKGLTLQQSREHLKEIRKAAKGDAPYFVVIELAHGFGQHAEVVTAERLIDLFDTATGPLYVVDVDALRDLLSPPKEVAA